MGLGEVKWGGAGQGWAGLSRGGQDRVVRTVGLGEVG